MRCSGGEHVRLQLSGVPYGGAVRPVETLLSRPYVTGVVLSNRRVPVTSEVVILTGSSEVDDVDRAYELGISSYLVKPVGFSAMQDVLARLGVPWMLLTAEEDA